MRWKSGFGYKELRRKAEIFGKRRVDLFFDFVILTCDRVFRCPKGTAVTAGIIGNQVKVLSDPVTVNEEQSGGKPLHKKCEKVQLC